MMESFKELAIDKVGGGMTTVLRENAVIQSNVAECEAKILSSRAFLMEMLDEYWDCLCAGDKPSFDLRARLRLSITYSMNQAREAATYAYHAAGTNAIFESNPFERRFRDIYTVSQQGQGHKSLWGWNHPGIEFKESNPLKQLNGQPHLTPPRLRGSRLVPWINIPLRPLGEGLGEVDLHPLKTILRRFPLHWHTRVDRSADYQVDINSPVPFSLPRRSV